MSAATLSQTTLRRVNRWKLVALMALLSTLFIILVTVDNLLLSALVAFVISYTIGPVVNYLERQGISRGLATAVTFFFSITILVSLLSLLAPYFADTLSKLQSDMPRMINGVGQFITELELKIHSYGGPLSSFSATAKVEAHLTEWTHDVVERVPIFFKTLLTVMLLGPFLAFFMIKDGRGIVTNLLGLVPNHLFEPALSLQHQINFQIGQFVRARMLESLIVGAVTAVGLLAISFPYALLLGLFAGVTNFIPYLGPIFGAIPALLIAMVNGYSGVEISMVILVYVIAQAIDGGLIVPLLVAKIVDLHPVTVIVVIIAGAQLMGVLGMIISIPVAGTLKVTFSTIYRHLTDTRS